jgi:hypothetical protein
MMLALPTKGSSMALERNDPAPSISDQNNLVRQCLERILQSPHFRASSRSKQFLSFVVGKKLEGREDEIKERTIGIELFDRIADFETSGDSIVRVNATDVRRRLGQYYQSSPNTDPVQIVLPPGTYVPEFVFLEIASPAARPVGRGAPLSLVVGRDNRPRRSWRFWCGLALTGIIFAVFLTLTLRPHPSNLDRFWQPVLDARSTPVINLPTTNTFQMEPEAMQQFGQLKPDELMKVGLNNVQAFHNWHTSLPVLQAALSVALALQRRGETPILRMGAEMTSDELRGHPIIAIGSFSNPWTKQNVSGLRFTFDRSASDTDVPRIRDNQNPGRSWALPSIYPKPQDKDYAIVTRTFDPVTYAPFVSLAGLHSFGNQIAAEFVSQESFWNDLTTRAPAGWEKMNLQVVLETDVVGTTPSALKIVDVYFWK